MPETCPFDVSASKIWLRQCCCCWCIKQMRGEWIALAWLRHTPLHISDCQLQWQSQIHRQTQRQTQTKTKTKSEYQGDDSDAHVHTPLIVNWTSHLWNFTAPIIAPPPLTSVSNVFISILLDEEENDQSLSIKANPCFHRPMEMECRRVWSLASGGWSKRGRPARFGAIKDRLMQRYAQYW